MLPVTFASSLMLMTGLWIGSMRSVCPIATMSIPLTIDRHIRRTHDTLVSASCSTDLIGVFLVSFLARSMARSKPTPVHIWHYRRLIASDRE